MQWRQRVQGNATLSTPIPQATSIQGEGIFVLSTLAIAFTIMAGDWSVASIRMPCATYPNRWLNMGLRVWTEGMLHAAILCHRAPPEIVFTVVNTLYNTAGITTGESDSLF